MESEPIVCPHCGSSRRKTILGADKYIVIQIVKKPSGEVVSEVIICADCGAVYDAIKEVK